MSKEEKSSIFSKIKKIKHIEIIIAVGAVVIMLILYFTTVFVPDTTKPITSNDYCENMKLQLEDAISQMNGAGKTKVIISWTSSISTDNDDNIFGSSNKPSVENPKAVGVVIICQGGDNVRLKIEIKEAVSTLLDITADKISIYTMKKK